MARKRDTAATTLLGRVVRGLESLSPRVQYKAIFDLLMSGPFVVPVMVPQAFRALADTETTERAELLAFLRNLVRWRDVEGYHAQIGTYGAVTYAAKLVNGAWVPRVDGEPRDVLVIQFIALLHAAGFDSVQLCTAPPAPGGTSRDICGRLYVKAYRRKFCSRTCQARDEKRRNRPAPGAAVKPTRRRVTRGR